MTNISDDLTAYYSMEIGIDNKIPTFSGGLGVLAGDTILSAADLKIPLVCFTLLYRKGYFRQHLDSSGMQMETPVEWRIEDHLEPAAPVVSVALDGRQVQVRAWRYAVKGHTGHTVDVYFLDTDVDGNSEWDRTITDQLYGGDWYYRLCQEVILGIGGTRMARALGHDRIRRFHMNEGHAALLTFELLRESAARAGRALVNGMDLLEVRRHCVFTTHTPVAAGHDRFRLSGLENLIHPLKNLFDLADPAIIDLLARIVDKDTTKNPGQQILDGDPWFNMTLLALNLSRYVNGVAQRHGEVSRKMFPGYTIEAITNGVHAGRWTTPPFKRLYDRYLPGWMKDNFALRHAAGIPIDDIRTAHQECKQSLIDHVNQTTGSAMTLDALTIGFARRAAVYKRADLLFTDIQRLKRMASNQRPIQLVFAGKAHPNNHEGKATIQRIVQSIGALEPEVTLAYIVNYDMDIGALITSGVDVWLNNPEPPMEASGTSGMKSALNGVPSLSMLDGWWVEGHVEGVTGWSLGESEDRSADADSLYDKLERVVLPLYYDDADTYFEMARHVICLNGSFFTSHRMLQEYVVNAYL